MAVRDSDSRENYWPQVTDGQRRVLDEIRRVYLETGDWPVHAHLEQVLEEAGIDLDRELSTIPELTFSPDNRRGGGGVFFQEREPVRLMFRGLVASTDGKREAEMFIAVIRWAVEERRAVRHQPQSVTEKQWRAADAIEVMGSVLRTPNPPAYAVKLVLEVMRTEPFETPKWSGVPDAFPNWQLDIPSGIRRFREVRTIDDYLRETDLVPARTGRARLPLTASPAAPPSRPDPHPVFGPLRHRQEDFDCFVLLPLSERFRTIYEETVEPVARELGMSCGHAEEIFGPGRIMDDIISSITLAKVVVAELTGRNPNVFYELGVAHEQGKQVVLMSQSMEDVPFDVRDRRVVVYQWDPVAPDAGEVMQRLRPHLDRALRAAERGEAQQLDSSIV